MTKKDTAIEVASESEVVEQTVSGYAALRNDGQAWAEEQEERDVLAGSLEDGLEAE